MKKILIGLGVVAAVSFGAQNALADPSTELNNVHKMLHKDAKATGGARTSSGLTNHGGPVIHSAHVVAIFWGPSWGTGGADNATAQHEIGFIGQFGTSTHYATITQYYDSTGSIQTTNLGNTAWFGSSTPPTNVTDAIVQQEVTKYLTTRGGTFDASHLFSIPAAGVLFVAGRWYVVRRARAAVLRVPQPLYERLFQQHQVFLAAVSQLQRLPGRGLRGAFFSCSLFGSRALHSARSTPTLRNASQERSVG